MTVPPCYCYCWAGRARWPLRPDDRFCGWCGRTLSAVLAHGLVLETGSPATLGVYLERSRAASPAGSALLTGVLPLELVGLGEETPRVDWKALEGPATRLLDARLSTTARLDLTLGVEAPVLPPPGRIGKGRLAVQLLGEWVEFSVLLFLVEGVQPQVRLCSRPGEPARGALLIAYRDAEAGRVYLEFELGNGIPVQWGRVHCAHPAVAIELLHAEKASAVARALIRWDLQVLSVESAGTRVTMGLQPRLWRALEFSQQIWWRLRHPLQCQPVGLVVPRLRADGPTAHRIHLTNVDRQDHVLLRVESEVPWVTPQAGPPVLPARLSPGSSVAIDLELRPHELNGAAAPHLGRLAFCLANRGRQFFNVRVDALRHTRPLLGPLLIDPGPPRVVLARLDPETRRVVYLRDSGVRGLAPTELGVAAADYARAVCGLAPADALLSRLLAAAIVHVQAREQLLVEQVRVCRQPWLWGTTVPDGVEVADWQDLCAARLASSRESDGPVRVARLDATTTYVLELAGAEEAPVFVAAASAPDEPPTLAAALVGGLLSRLQPSPRRRSVPQSVDPWMRLASASLLEDYRWGPEYAWQRFLEACYASLPASRRLGVDAAKADRYVRRWLVQQARFLMRATGRAGAWIFLCPLFAGNHAAHVLRSTVAHLPGNVSGVAAPWVEWLAASAPAPVHLAPSAQGTGRYY